MANNFGQRPHTFSASGGSGSGGVTSMSGHAQRFQQVKSPGSSHRRDQFIQSSFGEPYHDDGPSIKPASMVAPMPLKNFQMSKRQSKVRQDDVIDIRPKTTFKPMYQNPTTVAQHTFSTAGRPGGPGPGQTMASAYLRGPSGFLGRGVGQEQPAADQHDCTNEEQLDEFEMVDREEIFDECDEQTSIQRHQMNLGFTRHAVKNASPADLFNVFNRQGITPSSQPDAIAGGYMAAKGSRLTLAANQTSTHSRDDYQVAQQSPSIHDRSRQGNLSPPTEFAHLGKDNFFGSSFAAPGLSGSVNRAQLENDTNKTSAAALATKNYQMMQKNNQFAHSSNNRLQAVQHVNQQSRFIQERQAAAASIPTVQDKGPRNFRHLEMGLHQIPDQFRADRENVGQDLAIVNMLETSIQQDEESAEQEQLETFELSHSLLPNGDSQPGPGHSNCKTSNNYVHAEHNFLSTDQDTIIDQDDDVAEESSAVDHQDPAAQLLQTQIGEGPIYNRFMSQLANREEDIQDEEAEDEGQQLRTSQHNSFLGRQRSPAGFNLHTQQQTASNIPIAQPLSNINATMASNMMNPQLQTSQSSMTFSARGRPVANKPFAAMVVPKHTTTQSSVSRLQKNGQPNPSILDAMQPPRPVGFRSNGTTVVNSFAGSVSDNFPTEQTMFELQPVKRETQTKCDNKDSKMLPGEITLNELSGEVPVEQSSHPTTYQQLQQKKMTQKPEYNKFTQLSQSNMTAFGSNQAISGDTFRSPQAGSPQSKHQKMVSPKVTTIRQVAQNINVYEDSSSQPFLRENDDDEKVSHLLASNHSTAHRGSEIHRQTANFYSSEQRGATMMDVDDQTNTSLRLGEVFQQIEQSPEHDDNQSNNDFGNNFTATNDNDLALKSNMDLQKEYLDVQRQLKALQRTQAAQVQQVQYSKVADQQRQFFDDVTSLQSHATQQPLGSAVSGAVRKQQNNSMIYAKQATRHQQKNQKNHISDMLHNASNTKMNTQSNLTSHMTPKGHQKVVQKRTTVQESLLQQQLSNDHGHQRPASSQHHGNNSSSSNVRQMRLSARPGGGGEGNLMRSPKDDVKRHKQLTARRSPMPQRAAALANDVCNDTMSAKNFNIAKTDRTRLRNAQTFVEKGQRAGGPPRAQASHKHNRSVVSNQNEKQNEAASELLTQNLMLPGVRQPRAQAQQLQALAELRQRENNTVQTGQIILARQRSREAYLNTGQRSTGVAKSTQERLNPNQSSNSESVTLAVVSDRSNNNQHQHSRALGSSGVIPTHSHQGINHMTEQADNEANRRQSYLIQASHKFGSTFDHQNLDSVHNGDNESIEDVLSRSQSPESNVNEIEDDSGQGYHNNEEDVFYGQRAPYGGGQVNLDDDNDDDENEYDGEVERQLSSDDEDEGEHQYDSEEDVNDDDYYDEEDQRAHEDSSNGEIVYLDEDGNIIESADDYNILRQSHQPQISQHLVVRSGQKNVGAPARIQHTHPSKRALNYSASQEGDVDDFKVGGFSGQSHQARRNDSQKRIKYSAMGNQQRHKSPYDSKSQYSERKQMRQGQSHRGTTSKLERANQRHLRQQVGKQSNSTMPQRDKRGRKQQTEFSVDKNMKAQFNVTHNTRKRNQPLKININMTGGSTSGQNGAAVRQETNQSVTSNAQQQQQQQPQYHHHPHNPHQQQMMLAAMYAQSHPSLSHPNFYPQQAPQAGQDPTQQLQQYILQHQHQNQQILAALNPASQMTVPQVQQPAQQQQMAQSVYHHSNTPSTLTETNRINNHNWSRPEHNKDYSQMSVAAERPRTQSMFDDNDTASMAPKDDGVSWLRDATQSNNRQKPGQGANIIKELAVLTCSNLWKSGQEEDVSPEAKPAQEADEQDEMEELWKKLRGHELSKSNARKTEPSAVLQEKKEEANVVWPSASEKQQQEEEEDEQLENFMVMAKPNRERQKNQPSAIIIGFENGHEAAYVSPFTNKPVLGMKRQAAAAAKRVASVSGKEQTEKKIEQVTPLGADFKKVSVDQIQAREERLKKIKDQGLIEIAADIQPGGQQSEAPVNLADAFLAKRQARMMLGNNKDAQPLDQDLAVARDTSVNARVTRKVEKVTKTPKELAQIRKAMMKRKPATADLTEHSTITPLTNANVNSPMVTALAATSSKGRMSLGSLKTTKSSITKEPSAALMERLAGGKRLQIDKKEMKKLTKTNYENLPEIKRRKDEERKRQEALEKKERIAKYNKECKARSRAQLKKKRDQMAAAATTANQGV